jgi:hypothetical protein
MSKRILTILLSFLVLSCVTALYGQSSAPAVDKGANFTVNSNPTVYVPDSPMEEVFGSNANAFGPAGLRGRGNVYHCTTARKLIEQRSYLNPTAAASIQFLVYESTTFAGTYNLVASTDVSGQGPGEGWYSSGTMNFDLQPGMYYLIYPHWDVNANYYNQQTITPYPIPCSLGELVGGVGWDWAPTYSVPPAQTQTSTGLENTGVAYYQTIVTDDPVPVELSSFVYNLSGNDVNLTWVTASETNNQGFEIERSTNSGNFEKIGYVSGNGTSSQIHTYNYSDKALTAGNYSYRLKQVDFDGSANYTDAVLVTISGNMSFALNQNYPNPFNPTTNISFQLPSESKVSLKVYNSLGMEVATLINSDLSAGSHSVDFSASNLASGIYYYKLQAGDFTSIKKMTILK